MFLIISAIAAATTPAPAVKAPDADPIVCSRRRTGSEVGTHMRPKKVCMRKSDWAYQEKHTQRELQQINNKGNNPAPVGARGGVDE